MRILMLISELGYGGAETAFINLARELARTNHVQIAVFKEQYQGGDYQETDLPEGLKVHRLDPVGDPGRLRRWVRRISRLRALKRDLAVDATISFLTGPNALNSLSGGTGLSILSIRGSRRYDFNSSKTSRWLHRKLLDTLVHLRADAVVAVSVGLTHEVSGGKFGPGSKFRTISGYVDADTIFLSAAKPIEPELEFLNGQPVLVAAGRQSQEKGFDHLLRIFARVRDQVEDAKLLLVGDGPQRAALLSLCAEAGLRSTAGPAVDPEADVIFLGYRSEPNRYFGLAKAFVLPSLSEGFPNILVEALGAAIPVVVADTPWGSSEVLGVTRDENICPYPRCTPFQTRYGMLMPRIDDPSFSDHWTKVLVAYLTDKNGASIETGPFHRRVREFSCTNAAKRWNDLLGELAGKGDEE